MNFNGTPPSNLAWIDAAHYAGQHTVITKAAEPRAVLVPYEWWSQQRNRPV